MINFSLVTIVESTQKCDHFFFITSSSIAFNASWKYVSIWPLSIPEKYTSWYMIDFFCGLCSSAKTAKRVLLQEVLFV